MLIPDSFRYSLLDGSSSEGVREILVGGVQSEDPDLIQMLMEKVTCQDIIQAAVTKLPVEAVIPTLQVILSSLQKGKLSAFSSYQKSHEMMNNCPGLTCGGASTWLKCLLTAHSGFILSVPEAEELLTSIQSGLEERMRHLGPVYQLVGKLGMLDKQIREKQETDKDTEVEERGPLLLYQDDSGDELENVIDDLLVPASETDEDDWDEGDLDMESEQESDDCKIVNESDDNDEAMSDG